MEMKSTNKGTR